VPFFLAEILPPGDRDGAPAFGRGKRRLRVLLLAHGRSGIAAVATATAASR